MTKEASTILKHRQELLDPNKEVGATACKPLAGAYSACCAKASKYFHNRVIGNLDRVQPHKALARGINEAKRSGDTIEEHARTAAALKRVSDYIEEELENEAAYKRGERPIHFWRVPVLPEPPEEGAT